MYWNGSRPKAGGTKPELMNYSAHIWKHTVPSSCHPYPSSPSLFFALFEVVDSESVSLNSRISSSAAITRSAAVATSGAAFRGVSLPRSRDSSPCGLPASLHFYIPGLILDFCEIPLYHPAPVKTWASGLFFILRRRFIQPRSCGIAQFF